MHYPAAVGGPAVSSYVLCAPIQSPLGNVLGAVEVLSSKKYRHGDEDLLSRLCSALGSAMEHSRTYAQNERQVTRLADELGRFREVDDRERSSLAMEHAQEIDRRTGELKAKLAELQKMNGELRNELGAEKSAKERLRGASADLHLEAKVAAASKEIQSKAREVETAKLQIEAFIRETKTLKSENRSLVREKEEALTKLNTYRKHVKRARRAVELSMVEEEAKAREDGEAMETLQKNLQETQDQMVALQQQYVAVLEEKGESSEQRQAMEDALAAAQHQNARLRRQQEMLHGKLRSLARLESAQAEAQAQTKSKSKATATSKQRAQGANAANAADANLVAAAAEAQEEKDSSSSSNSGSGSPSNPRDG